MELFKGQSLLERKCGYKKYQVRKDFSRTCNICGDTEKLFKLFREVKVPKN